MLRRPPRSTRTDTLCPYTTLFRSVSRLLVPKIFALALRKGMAPAGTAEHEIPGILPIFLRSEEHTSELQSLMRISYAVFCLKKKNNKYTQLTSLHQQIII